MRRRALFGAHLYNQIVYPLLIAAVVVGVVATAVAVYFLEGLTDRWVADAASSSTENIANRYRGQAEQMLREARLVASDERLVAGARVSDERVIVERIGSQNAALDFDGIMVFDIAGRLVASSGRLTDPFVGDLALEVASRQSARPWACVVREAGHSALVAVYPVATGTDDYMLALIRSIDERFVRSLGVAEGTAYSLFDADSALLAGAVGDGFDKLAAARLGAAMNRPAPEIATAMQATTSRNGSASSVRLEGQTYRIWVTQVHLPGNVGPAATTYFVGARGKGLSEQASNTTRNLIAMWSLVAVVALVGLGGWIARRVSDPLVELSGGVRRIAEGDFTTKVWVEGDNEIAELARTFNHMTDSLRERSESLTKKVLELATLYEMSRSLGSTLDMDELLASVLDSALRIFDLDLGYVALRDRETGEIELRALRGGETGQNGALRSSMSEWVVREGRPLIFNPDSGAHRAQIDTVTGARAALCVPLVSPEGTIGSVTIGSSRADYRFSSDDVRLLSTIANHVTIAIGNIELFSSLQEAYLATVRSLAAAVDAKDAYTRGHSDRVAAYATRIAESMGLSHEQRVALEMAAYLHDIGKIGVREEILLKPGLLEDAEMAEMRHHPLIGANILKPVAFPWAITPVVRHHHEAYDGTGYPAGLRGDEIPLLARILTVADSFEAMTADRPYRAGRSADDAVEELRRCAGSQFDPRIVEVFAGVVTELDEEGLLQVSLDDEPAPEEVRAIFAALVEGIFTSFRKLGGPRLASNVEAELDEFLTESGYPLRLAKGQVVFEAGDHESFEAEPEWMRATLRHMDALMGRVSGGTLVEHFYTDAFEGLSERMRQRAESLRFYEHV
jgi:putative nucleotidyltransferase with HDIG domain